MSSTNYAISIIVILILGLIVKEAAIQDSIKIILCTIVGIVAYSALNTRYSTEKFATIKTKKWITVQMINDMIDTKIAALPSSSSSSAGAMTFDQVNTMIRDKMGTISASPSASLSSLTSGQLDNLAKLTVLSDLKTSELNTLAKLAETPPVGLTPAQTTTLTTLGALSGLTAAQTTTLSSLSGLTVAQTATLMGLIAPPVTVAGVATTSIQLPDNMPSGTIVIWANALTTGANRGIPSGWVLCDGTQGTPDLKGRFVMGINETHIDEKKTLAGEVYQNERSAMKYDADGGAENITLKKENIPSHRHFGAKIGNHYAVKPDADDGMTPQSASHCDTCDNRQTDGGTYTGYWGGDGEKKTKQFSILPNYKVLCYIMKK